MPRKIDYFESINLWKNLKKEKKKSKLLKKIMFIRDVRYKLSGVL